MEKLSVETCITFLLGGDRGPAPEGKLKGKQGPMQLSGNAAQRSSIHGGAQLEVQLTECAYTLLETNAFSLDSQCCCNQVKVH